MKFFILHLDCRFFSKSPAKVYDENMQLPRNDLGQTTFDVSEVGVQLKLVAKALKTKLLEIPKLKKMSAPG